MNSLLALAVHWHVFNSAQQKHVTRLPLSCRVSCLKKSSSVCDYFTLCSMQSPLSVINNLLHFLLMFPDSSAACNPSQSWQISANAVKCEGVLSVVLLALGRMTREATDDKNIYNLHSTCSHYENISLLAEVDANSNRNIKKFYIRLTKGYFHSIISCFLNEVVTRRLGLN